jgi:type VI secretion system protein ImpJ
MFLRPQHFQQQVRYIENYVEQRCAPLHSYSWGFSQLQLDQQLLGMGKVALAAARGIFPDGTPFNIPDDDEPPLPVELDENTRDVRVYLAMPLRRPGTPEIDTRADPESLARYRSEEIEAPDNSTAGGNTSGIEVGRMRTRLLLESDQRDGYACLGIVHVVEQKIDKSVLVNEEYIAPGIDFHALPVVAGFMKELYGLLSHRAEALAGRVSVSGRGGAADIADFLLLQVVNRYLPLIGHLNELPDVHPESIYRLGVTMAGEMATFTTSGKRAPVFEPYRHDDLQGTFRPVMDVLRQSLSMVLEQTAISIKMQERKYGVRVATITDHALLDQAGFVLAVSADMPTEELRKRLPAQIKIGPVEQIRQLVNVQLPGIRIRPIPVAPRQIPYHTGFVYFELDRSSELWSQLKTSGGFAFHLGGDFPGMQMEFWAIRG